MSESSDKSIRHIVEQAAAELEKLERADEQTRRAFMWWVTTSSQHIEEALAMAELNATLTSVLQREWASRSTQHSAAASDASRRIWKYPNRRLFDAAQQRYITGSDIRAMVTERIDFVVVDRKSQKDITRSILFHLIAAQEHEAECLMSREFLADVIRAHGDTSREMIGIYLEQSLKLLAAQQSEARNSAGEMDKSGVSYLARKNYQRWRQVQDELYRSLMGVDGRPMRESVTTTAAFYFSKAKIIQQYPNKKLYDTAEGRYVTPSDLRNWTLERIEFVVIDKRTGEDTTRSILLQLVAEQECGADPLMSREFLAEVIRCYDSTSDAMISIYLEQSLRLCVPQRGEPRNEGSSEGKADNVATAVKDESLNDLAQKNYQRWRQVQDEIYRTLMNPDRSRRDHGDPDSERPPHMKPNVAPHN